MKKTALSLIAVAAFFAASPAGAVDAGCNWSFEDSRPCNGGGSLAFNTVGAYDDQPVPAVIPVADRRQVRKPVYSATCDYNIAGGSGTPIFGKCAETGEELAPVIDADKAAEDHYNRTMQDISERGGCSADNLPFSVAAHCWNWANHNYPMGGGIGSAGGSGD